MLHLADGVAVDAADDCREDIGFSLGTAVSTAQCWGKILNLRQFTTTLLWLWLGALERPPPLAVYSVYNEAPEEERLHSTAAFQAHDVRLNAAQLCPMAFVINHLSELDFDSKAG